MFEMLQILKNIRENIESDLKENPYSVLCESDLQFHIYRALSNLMPDHIKIRCHRGTELSVARIYSEYRIKYDGGEFRPDLVVLDAERIRQSVFEKGIRNEYHYLWSMPLAAIIEVKYCGKGDSRRVLADEVRKDVIKLKKWEREKDFDPIVWLCAFDQHRNFSFAHSQLSLLSKLKG